MKTIKEFARLCQTTGKTLRFYDRVGILKAEYINPENGYRHYNEQQTDQFTQINELKQIGFSLKKIEAILSETDTSKILQTLLKKESELADASIKCRQMIGQYEKLVQKEKETAQFPVILHRLADKNEIILDNGKYRKTFFCDKGSMDICCEVLRALFCHPTMSIDLNEIPEYIEKPTLMMIIPVKREKLSTFNPSCFLQSHKNRIEKIRTVFLRIKGVDGSPTLDEMDDIVTKISQCSAEKTIYFWCVDYDCSPSNKENCKIELQLLAFEENMET